MPGTPPLIEFLVVSLPPTISSMRVPKKSHGVIDHVFSVRVIREHGDEIESLSVTRPFVP